MDADIASLVKEERLAEAASLAASRGQHRLSSDLYERACSFAEAAGQAIEALDGERALLLACAASEEPLAERALTLIVEEGTRVRVAHELARRGHHAWSGRALEAAGRAAEAATAWARAGRADRAAELLDRLGDPMAAGRELESALRASPDRHDLRVQLGKLLLRHGRVEAAVRALQAVPAEAPERAAALAELVRALETLGLSIAAAEARTELERLGGPRSTRTSEHPPASAIPVSPARARLFGRYEVVREVASTATAHVMEAIDALTSERVALKVFAGSGLLGAGRDALARFEREMEILKTLRHPNVVPLRDYVPEGPALVLAWMAGGSLAQMLDQDPLAPTRAIEITAAVLDALSAAHRAGIIHRDVKPSNVLFDGAGAARLSDFGAAHLGDLAATATAGIIGTYAYMSPEQREGRPATIVSDLYSVGVMLRRMLTPGVPADAASTVQPSAAHRDLGPAHDEVVARMTSARPEERPRDALEARRALLALRWPTTHEPIAKREITPQPARAAQERLVPRGHDRYLDEWTGRVVRIAPLTERSLARAKAFALAGGRGVETILRVDTARAQIWIEELEGPALDRPLTKDEARVLERALAILHEAGITHGHVDASRVCISERFGVALRFEAEAAPTATPDLDRLALASLRDAER